MRQDAANQDPQNIRTQAILRQFADRINDGRGVPAAGYCETHQLDQLKEVYRSCGPPDRVVAGDAAPRAKPSRQRRPRILKDRARRHRGLAATCGIATARFAPAKPARHRSADSESPRTSALKPETVGTPSLWRNEPRTRPASADNPRPRTLCVGSPESSGYPSSGIFEGAMQPDGMHRRPNAAGLSPRAVKPESESTPQADRCVTPQAPIPRRDFRGNR